MNLASTTSHPHLLFLYGTLKRGHSRHHALSHQLFLSNARTLPQYRMVNLGSYPALLTPGSTSIHGELWQVTPACLTLLDQIEATAEKEYHRAQVLLAPPHDALIAEAYFYCADCPHLPDHGDIW